MLAPLALVAGCHIDIEDPGTEPPADQLDFPSGLLLDPDGQHLYVSNGNSDLKYGGGTIQIVDVARFGCAVDQFRGGADPARCDAATAQADVQACQADPLDPGIVNCDETPFILRDATVKVGNFAGNLVLNKTSDTARQLFAAVRGDPSITAIKVDFAGPAYDLLHCFDAPRTAASEHPPACDASHLVQHFDCQDGQPGCTENQQVIPGEPFGLRLDHGTKADGTAYSRLLVSHLLGGEVMVLDVISEIPRVLYVSGSFFPANSAQQHGAFDLAPQHPGQASSLWYMSSNLQPTLALFRVADADVVVPAGEVPVTAFNTGADIRSLAFDEDGNRLFLAENNPPSLLVVDTRPQPPPAPSGTNVNQLVDIIDVCQQPSKLALRTVHTPGAPGEPELVQTHAFVSCFLSNQLMIIDPDRPVVLATISTGRGPNEIVFGDGAEIQESARAPRAYLANFSESTIGVIDLDPESRTVNRMIARIGIPVPPPNP